MLISQQLKEELFRQALGSLEVSPEVQLSEKEKPVNSLKTATLSCQWSSRKDLVLKTLIMKQLKKEEASTFNFMVKLCQIQKLLTLVLCLQHINLQLLTISNPSSLKLCARQQLNQNMLTMFIVRIRFWLVIIMRNLDHLQRKPTTQIVGLVLTKLDSSEFTQV